MLSHGERKPLIHKQSDVTLPCTVCELSRPDTPCLAISTDCAQTYPQARCMNWKSACGAVACLPFFGMTLSPARPAGPEATVPQPCPGRSSAARRRPSCRQGRQSAVESLSSVPGHSSDALSRDGRARGSNRGPQVWPTRPPGRATQGRQDGAGRASSSLLTRSFSFRLCTSTGARPLVGRRTAALSQRPANSLIFQRRNMTVLWADPVETRNYAARRAIPADFSQSYPQIL